MEKFLSNKEVVQLLKEALAAMEIKGENRFAIRAYQNVIAAIDGLTSSVHDMWENNRLDEIAGIGTTLKGHLDELFTTGEVKEWIEKKKDLPKGMFELLVIRGVGAKTAFKLAQEFDIQERRGALIKVKRAAEANKIQELAGFGEKSEADILSSIKELKKSKQEKQRTMLVHAEEISERVTSYLKESEHVEEATSLGSHRRRASTVGDLDIAVSSNKSEEVIKHFVKFPEIKTVETEGDKMSTVILKNDMQIDILVTKPESYGSLLQHFTGSKQHNILLRQHALSLGKSLSQYGIKEKGELKEVASEEEFYKELGLPLIPVELREGKNEIELAKKNKLPKLIELKDIKGDLHMHTPASDGMNTLEELLESAIERGYEYIGTADHAPSVQSRGKFEVLGIIEQTRKKIDDLNSSQDKVKILYGYEVNILKDETLSMPEELLEKLDFVIASIHTSFEQSRKEITDRLVKAIENPHVSIIGHPSGRLINERPAYEVDWERLFEAALKHDKIIEINADPHRLDLADHLVHDAIKKGVKLVISTDAHSVVGLNNVKYGIDVARRGWCEAKDIINTQSLEDFLKNL